MGVSEGFCQIDPNSGFHTEVLTPSRDERQKDPSGRVPLPLSGIRCGGGGETSHLLARMKGARAAFLRGPVPTLGV